MADQLFGVTIGYHRKSRFTHFITLVELDKIIAEIMILSPPVVEDAYKISNTWFVEYFLNRHLWNRGIMSGAITAIVNNMQEQGIKNIGAVVDRRNTPSIKVLGKAGFKLINAFDPVQDLYKI